MYKAWSAIIHLRRDYEVFTSTDTDVDLNVSGAVKRIRLTHPSMNVAIIGNFDVRARSVALPFQHAGTWYDFFTGASIEVVDPAQVFTLEPGEFHIYTDAPVETPEQGLITVDVEEDGPAELPATVRLEAPYPNPFTEELAIRFALPDPRRVRIEVFDMLGRRVKVLADEFVGAGSHARSWDTSDLAGGSYVLRFSAGAAVSTRTIVRIK